MYVCMHVRTYVCMYVCVCWHNLCTLTTPATRAILEFGRLKTDLAIAAGLLTCSDSISQLMAVILSQTLMNSVAQCSSSMVVLALYFRCYRHLTWFHLRFAHCDRIMFFAHLENMAPFSQVILQQLAMKLDQKRARKDDSGVWWVCYWSAHLAGTGLLKIRLWLKADFFMRQIH